MAELYRKSSIEKLSNPEQLDRTITISSHLSWLALIGIALIIAAVVAWSIMGTLSTTINVSGIIVSPENVCTEFSDYSGTIEKIYISAGNSFSKDAKIADIRTLDGTLKSITAKSSGKAFAPLKNIGDPIFSGSEVARFTPTDMSRQIAVCYVPSVQAQQLKENMRVLIYPMNTDGSKSGHLEATIQSVGSYPAEIANMSFVLGSGNYVAEQFAEQGSVTAVVCKLKTDSATKSGYYWSSENGKNQTLDNGTFISAKIVVEECAPITKLFNGLKEKLEDR